MVMATTFVLLSSRPEPTCPAVVVVMSPRRFDVVGVAGGVQTVDRGVAQTCLTKGEALRPMPDLTA
jgi:hypothetical protein